MLWVTNTNSCFSLIRTAHVAHFAFKTKLQRYVSITRKVIVILACAPFTNIWKKKIPIGEIFCIRDFISPLVGNYSVENWDFFWLCFHPQAPTEYKSPIGDFFLLWSILPRGFRRPLRIHGVWDNFPKLMLQVGRRIVYSYPLASSTDMATKMKTDCLEVGRRRKVKIWYFLPRFAPASWKKNQTTKWWVL